MNMLSVFDLYFHSTSIKL